MNPALFSLPSNSYSIFTKRSSGLEIFTWLVSPQKTKQNKTFFFLVTLCIQIEKILKHDSNMETTSVQSSPSHGDGNHAGIVKLFCSVWITSGRGYSATNVGHLARMGRLYFYPLCESTCCSSSA